MDEKELEKQLEQMSFNGLLEYNWENPQHEKQYVLPMFVPGSAEFTNMNSTVLEEHPEMGRFFNAILACSSVHIGASPQYSGLSAVNFSKPSLIGTLSVIILPSLSIGSLTGSSG